MPSEQSSKRTLEIRRLNDRFRQTLSGGEVMLTAGVQALPDADRTAAVRAVVGFDDFDQDTNDPYGEHDFGLISLGENHFFFKIDYYDLKRQYASADPSNESVTRRVLTIMLAEEY